MISSRARNLWIHSAVRVPAQAQADVHMLFFRMMNWMRIPHDAELHLHFVSVPEMASVNEEFKMKQGPTDVLSIAGSGSGKEEECWVNDILLSDQFGSLRTRTELTDLGDIYICPQYIIQKSARNPRCCLQTDVYFISAYIHAFLHVLGFDHVTDTQFEEMSRVERNLGLRVKRAMMRGELPPMSRYFIHGL